MLSETSQRREDKYCVISLTCGIIKTVEGIPAAVQGLELSAFIARGLGSAHGQELRSCKL